MALTYNMYYLTDFIGQVSRYSLTRFSDSGSLKVAFMVSGRASVISRFNWKMI